jgi:hypothetical protein
MPCRPGRQISLGITMVITDFLHYVLFNNETASTRLRGDVNKLSRNSWEELKMRIRKSLLGLTAGALALVGAAPVATAGEFDGVTCQHPDPSGLRHRRPSGRARC